MAQLIGVLSHTPKVWGFNFRSEQIPGFQVLSLVRKPKRDNQMMFFSHIDVSLSLSNKKWPQVKEKQRTIPVNDVDNEGCYSPWTRMGIIEGISVSSFFSICKSQTALQVVLKYRESFNYVAPAKLIPVIIKTKIWN